MAQKYDSIPKDGDIVFKDANAALGRSSSA
jgi:hypothetical protein